ncbi:MAG: lytic transglycosylase domain-containing protein [Desulfobacterales bacterium]|nr:lytic transglycosylase domain-containing protein [Desulfobacterales bacterium]
MYTASSSDLFSEGLARWLFIVSMILVLAGPPLYEGRNSTHTVVEQPLICEAGALTPLPEKDFIKGLEQKPEQRFHPIILKAANRFQVDPALVKAIIMAESGYDPRAISKVGAKGLMQLMPATAEELGVEDIFNPKHNINAGVGYFKKLLNRFDGDIKLALAAYNAGTGKVRQYQGIPPFKATRYYIKKVFEYYQIYKKQMAGKPDRA